MQALAYVAVRVEGRPGVPDGAQAGLVALALAGLAYPVEERHRAVLRQALDVGREGRLGGVARYG